MPFKKRNIFLKLAGKDRSCFLANFVNMRPAGSVQGEFPTGGPDRQASAQRISGRLRFLVSVHTVKK